MKSYKLHISKRQMGAICREIRYLENCSENDGVRGSRSVNKNEQEPKSTWMYKGEK